MHHFIVTGREYSQKDSVNSLFLSVNAKIPDKFVH